MQTLKERLLAHFEISEKEWAGLNGPAFSNGIPLFTKKEEDFDHAFALLEKIKKEKGRILVYGDYDCDGVMSTSIILRTLREYGIEASGYLPSREKDGYGLTEENVIKIAKAQYQAIFLCDNGVSQFSAIELAKKLNLDVLVLDHHTLPSTLPKSDILLHPSVQEYGDIPVSAGFYAYLFSRKLLKKDDFYLRALAALSTISDVMPLKKYNRTLVKEMLEDFENDKIPEFIPFMGKEEGRTEEEISRFIIAKINALGRMDEGKMNRLLLLFANREQEVPIIQYLDKINEEKKEETNRVLLSLKSSEKEPAIVEILESKPGIAGLIANRLLEEKGKPCAIFVKKNGNLVASIRTGNFFSAIDFLKHLPFTPLAFGGHSGAAGCTIKEEDFEIFKKEFLYIAIKSSLNETVEEEYIPLSRKECTLENMSLIRSFAPFGEGWKNPTFSIGPFFREELTFVKEGKYLSFSLPSRVRFFSFQIGEEAFSQKKKISLIGKLKEQRFKGHIQETFFIEKIAPHLG